MSTQGDWFWPLAGAALLAWFAYDKWWTEDASKEELPKIEQAYPEGPLAELSDGTVWRMAWGRIKGPRTARTAWVRADHSRNKSRKERETFTLFLIDCETSGYRTLSVVDYDKNGKVIRSLGERYFGKDFDYAPPGSNIESVVDGACLPQFDPKPAKATKG